eukprot:9481502-Pyramimonas_sp.AAC.1
MVRVWLPKLKHSSPSGSKNASPSSVYRKNASPGGASEKNASPRSVSQSASPRGVYPNASFISAPSPSSGNIVEVVIIDPRAPVGIISLTGQALKK